MVVLLPVPGLVSMTPLLLGDVPMLAVSEGHLVARLCIDNCRIVRATSSGGG